MKKVFLAAIFAVATAQSATYVTVTNCPGEAGNYPECVSETREVRKGASLRDVWDSIVGVVESVTRGNKGGDDCGWGGEAGHYPECRN